MCGLRTAPGALAQTVGSASGCRVPTGAAQPAEVPFEGGLQAAVVCAHGGRSGHDHEVDPRERIAVQPKDLPGQSLQAAAIDGAPHLLARDGQAQPRLFAATPCREDSEIGVGRTFRSGEDPLVIAGGQEPGGAWESAVQNGRGPC